MSTNPNVAVMIDELLQRVEKLTTADKIKPTTFNVANLRRAEAIAAKEAAAGIDPLARESAWLDDSF